MDDDNPCVGICIIGDDGRCEGCGRTEDEIYGVPPASEENGAPE